MCNSARDRCGTGYRRRAGDVCRSVQCYRPRAAGIYCRPIIESATIKNEDVVSAGACRKPQVKVSEIDKTIDSKWIDCIGRTAKTNLAGAVFIVCDTLISINDGYERGLGYHICCIRHQYFRTCYYRKAVDRQITTGSTDVNRHVISITITGNDIAVKCRVTSNR